MQHLHDALKTALSTGAIPMALDALVDIAEAMIEEGQKERAAEILALALCYPLDEIVAERADELFRDLEAELCPRVIYDAKARTVDVTLVDEARNIIASEI